MIISIANVLLVTDSRIGAARDQHLYIFCLSGLAKNATLLRKIFKIVQYAQIIEDYTDQYSTRLPCELEPGDTCTLFLPFDKDCLFSEPFTHVGITDSYGRTHWAPKKDITKARKKYKERFSQNNQP